MLKIIISYSSGELLVKGKTHSTDEIICLLRQADGGATA